MVAKIATVVNGRPVYFIAGHPGYGITENGQIYSRYHHKFIKRPRALKGVLPKEEKPKATQLPDAGQSNLQRGKLREPGNSTGRQRTVRHRTGKE